MAKKIRVNIKPLWEEAKLTNNQDVAFDLELNPNTVSSYKNGNIQNPKIMVLVKFRDYFQSKLGRKIILEDLLEIEEEDTD